MKERNTPSALISVSFRFVRSFINELFDDRLGYYASSLSWSTLFAIIPILAILLAVFTSLPIFDTLYQQLHSLLFESLLPLHSKEIISYIDGFVANSGKLGAVGVIYVTIAAVMFFKDYDFIVNDIFETKKRTLWEALKTYTALVIIVPVMLGGSFYLSAQLQELFEKNSIGGVGYLSMLLPYLLIWAMFYISYQLSAHKKISKRATVISSFIASLIWNLAKGGFLYYVSTNKTYMSIYGGVGTVMFFFLWIYISWAIFLHGLRLCYLLDKEEGVEHIEGS